MKTYEFIVTVKTTVEAFNENDAKEIIHDNLDPGTTPGMTIEDVKIKLVK